MSHYSHPTRILTSALAAVLLCLVAAVSARAQDDGAYRLGPTDQVALRVVAWNSVELDFVRYDEIEGTYTIGADGRLSLPLTGPIDAAGLTAIELAEIVTERLQARLGSTEPPSTAVEVVGYRPIYVLGDVARPGAYDWRPGLNAEQALALAGGPYRVDVSGGGNPLREATRSRGALRENAIDRARLSIRHARLEAELRNEDSFDIPAGLSHPDGPEALAALVEGERALLASREESFDRALESFDATLALLRTEAQALEGKLSGLDRQLALVTTSVENMEQLLERGLARSPNLVALERQRVDLEARELDTETALFRARQQITEVERDRIELQARRQQERLDDLQRERTELAQLDAREAMLRELLVLSGLDLMAEDDEGEDVPTYAYVLVPANAPTDPRTVAGDTRLSPLDTLRVERIAPPDASAADPASAEAEPDAEGVPSMGETLGALDTVD